MNAILNFILKKSHFPVVLNSDLEQKKIGLLRILLGLIVFTRFYQISYSLHIYYDSEKIAWSIIVLGLTFLLTIGLFTPIVTILLFGSLRLLDNVVGTDNLGTIILINTLLVLILVNHGRYYSIDNLILKRNGLLSKVLNRIYSFIGRPDSDDISKAYILGFLVYAIISFGALQLHLEDSYWREGLTIKSLLTNSYLSKFYYLFRWIEENSPKVFDVFSATGGILQSIFQFLMIPLMFLRAGRYFVIIWGLNFILISIFFINLSYLPHIELVLWLLIFFPVNDSSARLKICFDDYCNLCKRTISFLRLINYNGKFEFIPTSNIQNPSTNIFFLTGSYGNKELAGYDIYLVASKLNPLLWLFFPILLFGKFSKVGPLIYHFIAKRRYRIFGRCEISFSKKILKSSHFKIARYRVTLINIFYTLYGVLLIFFILLVFPTIGEKIRSVFFKDSSFPIEFKYAIEKVGLHIPGVFNKTDLSMGDNWMVVSRMSDNGEITLVPITAQDGSRLNYSNFDFLNFTNHNSDFLYFGCTLGYRREILNANDIVQFHEGENAPGKYYIEKKIIYDYKINQLTGNAVYKIEVFSSRSSEVELFVTNYTRHNSSLVYSRIYEYNGKSLVSK